jgi:spore maturation protein CgeB
MWVIDAPINFSNILDAAPYYDFIFCGGTEAVEIFKNFKYENVEWLPFACDPEYHFPLKDDNSGQPALFKDVVFVGSNYPSRVSIFESLNLGEYDFGIWGSGWNKLSPDSPLKQYIQKIHTKPDEWIKIYCNSKIVLVTHYPGTNNIPVYQASPKIYEALACGSFIICDNQKDVRSLFNDGEHLVIFSDLKDLDDKIHYYLYHHAERKEIAASGRQEVLKKHTYFHRLNKLLSTLRSSGILSIK